MAASARLRFAEILAPLSYVTDLGMGEPEGQALRSTMLAVRAGEIIGLSTADRADCFYTSLLRHIGCTASAHEESAFLVPDHLAFRSRLATTDATKPREALALTRDMLASVPLGSRPSLLRHMVSPSFEQLVQRSVCEVAATTARRLDLGTGVETSLFQIGERWDGKGQPDRVRGEGIAVAARVAQACAQLASLSSALGAQAACAALGERAGGWLDPDIAQLLAERGVALLAEIDDLDLLDAVPSAEPGLARTAAPADVDRVARVFADLTDLRTPWTHGHSPEVAVIAERAAAEYGLSADEQVAIRRAALLHDLGRVGVPNSIWEKPGPLGATDWERVRLYPYHSERILSRCPALVPAARLAGMHRECQDGSGYYRQLTGSAIPPGARVLAAADEYQAMTQDRSYRPGRTPEEAASELRRMGAAGRLDVDAVRAVCAAVGTTHESRAARWPAGLTGREVEVLRLVAGGLSNRAIGTELHISARTAEHHVQSVYGKIGLATRAGAALFAMEHGMYHPDR
jgi:HD-GYP domain-containing protein (c-di-GMP phosphodiesterase class II)